MHPAALQRGSDSRGGLRLGRSLRVQVGTAMQYSSKACIRVLGLDDSLNLLIGVI